MVWGTTQIATGTLSDKRGCKWMITAGMWLQAVGIWLTAAAPNFVHALTDDFWLWVAGAVLLGFSTALVYPTRLAAIGALGHCDAWQKTLR